MCLIPTTTKRRGKKGFFHLQNICEMTKITVMTNSPVPARAYSVTAEGAARGSLWGARTVLYPDVVVVVITQIYVWDKTSQNYKPQPKKDCCWTVLKILSCLALTATPWLQETPSLGESCWKIHRNPPDCFCNFYKKLKLLQNKVS